MKIAAEDLLELGVVDAVVPEPVGGAHRDPRLAVERLGDAIEAALVELETLSGPAIRAARREKFLKIGRSLA